jgi:magnesium transporter
MSGSIEAEETVRTAVPVADLGELERALRGGDLALALKHVRPADVGRELSRLHVDDGRRILEAADERYGGAILRSAHPAVAARVLARSDPKCATCALAHLPTDTQVAILGQLAPEERERLEQTLDPESKTTLGRLLSQHASSVGRLMTPKIWRVEKNATAGEALRKLRENATGIEVAANCYVTDENCLVGVVPLREVATSPPERPLAEFMATDVIAVREDAERQDAAEIISTHNFLSLPILDHQGHLVGAVTVDDLLDAALSKGGVGFLNQAGVAGSVAAQVPYFQTSIARVVRSRITWLVLLFVAETATGSVLRHFEDALAKWVDLAFFIPLLIGTGGNAGSQTVSTVIRALALGEIRMKDVLRVAGKEIVSGVLLGLLLGTIAFFRAKMWHPHEANIPICVGFTVVAICTWANAVGAFIPIAAQRVGIDPTVISAPLITTLVDASGLFLYLTIATLILA